MGMRKLRAETVYHWLGACHVSSDLLMCVCSHVSFLLHPDISQKRNFHESRTTTLPSTIHIRVDRRLKKPEESWKPIMNVGLSMSLALMSSVTYPDSRIHGQVTETQRIWTWRRTALSIFSRNYLRWTEELPCLHCHRRDRRKLQPSPPYRRQALHQHPHRWVIYVCMYSAPNRLFSLLQGAVKTLLQPYGWNNWSMGLLSSGRFPAELYQSTALYSWSIPPHTNYQGYPIWYYKVLIQTIVTPSLQYR